MEIFMNQILPILLSALGVLLTGLVSWLTARIVAWLNNKIKDDKAKKWATDLANIIMSAVQTIMQTYVNDLKKEGAFTKEAQIEAFNKCMDIITSQLTPELKQYIEDNFGDMEVYLKAQIEAFINSLKTSD